MYDLAESILRKCKQVAQLSDLETVVYLFREALVQRPAPHPLRSDSLNDLSRALVVRFWQKGQIEDLDEAVLGYSEAVKSYGVLEHDSQRDVCFTPNAYTVPIIDPYLSQGVRRNEHNNDDQEAIEIAALANTILGQVYQPAQISGLDTVVTLHREALLLRPKPDVKRSSSLSSLAIALTTRFHHTSVLQDMDEAISLGREALILLPELHPDRSGLLNTLSAMLLIRFDKTAQSLDMRDAALLRKEALSLGLGGGRGAMRGSGGASKSQPYVYVVYQLMVFVI